MSRSTVTAPRERMTIEESLDVISRAKAIVTGPTAGPRPTHVVASVGSAVLSRASVRACQKVLQFHHVPLFLPRHAWRYRMRARVAVFTVRRPILMGTAAADRGRRVEQTIREFTNGLLTLVSSLHPAAGSVGRRSTDSCAVDCTDTAAPLGI